MLMEALHMNQQSFASFTGIAPASISSVLQERTRPTLKMVESLYNKIPNLSLEWLMTGKGEMFLSAEQSKADELSGASSPVEPSQTTSSGSQMPLALDFSYDQVQPSKESVQNLQTIAKPGQHRTNANIYEMKNIDKPQRRITEIRVFYDDQTWESFVPKK